MSGRADACHRRDEKSDGLFEGHLGRAAVRGLQVDDLYAPSRGAGLSQAREQLAAPCRRRPAPDDDPPRPGGGKGPDKDVSGFTDRWAQQWRRSGQFASQPGGELTWSEWYRPGTDVTTDDDDGRFRRPHQPAAARAK